MLPSPLWAFAGIFLRGRTESHRGIFRKFAENIFAGIPEIVMRDTRSGGRTTDTCTCEDVPFWMCLR